MTNCPYIIVMDDGTRLRFDAGSAGEAIEIARWAHREHLVKECFQGLVGQDPQWGVGFSRFNVPEHSAVSKDAVLAKPRPSRRKDNQTETFGFFNNVVLTNEPPAENGK